MDYPALDILPQGLSVAVIGRNQDSSLWQAFTKEDSRFLSTKASLQGDSWWQVMSPNLQRDCWLSGNVIDLSGDTSAVPVVQAAPPPVAVPSDTPVPPVNCAQYTSNTCNQQPACTWKNGACVNK
jgi:hypothetical protein